MSLSEAPNIGAFAGKAKGVSTEHLVAIKLSEISKSLDPVFFYDTLVTEVAVLGYKTSIGTTSTAMYD